MRRKIVQQGSGALTISLPHQWTKTYNLTAGEEIELVEDGPNLVIQGKESYKPKTKELHLKKIDNFSYLRSLIASMYKAGYNEIIIYTQIQPPLQEINKVINTFTGLELVEQTEKKIRIKAFLHSDETEIEHLIIKLFQTNNTFLKEIEMNWEKTDLNNAQTLVRFNIRKMRDHCLRMIHIRNFGKEKSYEYYDVVTQLEKVAAEQLELLEEIIKTKPKEKKYVAKLIINFEALYKAYLKKEEQFSNTIWNEQRIYLQEFNLKKKLKEGNTLIPILVYFLSKRFLHIASRIVSLSS
ncbi:MAG: hypothetical protein A2729_04935 [Candidatus Buchananbacteria bacterium RIFCSPHIGHO2_01_FULL_39_14]|uniref:SpoVT-AbrB domain-containing protein n=1 Tax=Candidatus Buchananbacteria bacterium RIFCSPHIGHO2_01_FULL_39_14 TaxID=1797532 RepID=A0A1G1XXP3_9BACT|nr:MAG: hypothetical protein A2729_04935 [Candidatus Buchananbacteria bacterium RIFCSPHIGHO2_01_FULL_39_14]